jgi:hypothetical protein
VSEHDKDTESGQDATFDREQQPMFGNENANPEATRPPLGSQTDAVLPGSPTAGNEDFEPLAKPTNETERGDKV